MTNGFAHGKCSWLLMDNFALLTTMNYTSKSVSLNHGNFRIFVWMPKRGTFQTQHDVLVSIPMRFIESVWIKIFVLFWCRFLFSLR